MVLTLYHKGTGRNITQLCSGVTWAGDKNRASRSLRFDLIPQVEIQNGDHVTLTDADTVLFFGMVVTLKAATGAATVDVTAYDNGIYLANNEGTYQFKGVTPEAAARQICRDYGITLRSAATTGIAVRRKFSGVKLWQIICTMYTKAGEQNGKRYLARFRGKELEIVERVERSSNLVIRPGSNLFSATTTRSIENLCNSVAIYNKDGTRLQVIEDAEAVQLYGLMQHHIQQSDGEDATREARTYLEDNGAAETVSVTAAGDTAVICGETVCVRQESTGLEGIFWVESDSHTWKGGVHQMALSLNCRNVAYTASSGSEIKT